jgi:hypothetical protein
MRVLTLARNLYDVICADLGGYADPISMGLLEESQRIFLVTTSELAPLHFAKVRVKQLTELGLKDRLSLVLNRDHRKDLLTSAQVEDAVGIPVSFAFPNAYESVQRAILVGEPVPPRRKWPSAFRLSRISCCQRGLGRIHLRLAESFLSSFGFPMLRSRSVSRETDVRMLSRRGAVPTPALCRLRLNSPPVTCHRGVCVWMTLDLYRKRPGGQAWKRGRG